MTGEPLPQHLNSNLARIRDDQYFCNTSKVEARNECSIVLLIDTDADAGFGPGALGSSTDTWTLFRGHVVLRFESNGRLGKRRRIRYQPFSNLFRILPLLALELVFASRRRYLMEYRQHRRSLKVAPPVL